MERILERVGRDELSAIILTAPGWARAALTMPDEQMRERAADAIAATIIEKTSGETGPDRDQLALPL